MNCIAKQESQSEILRLVVYDCDYIAGTAPPLDIQV